MRGWEGRFEGLEKVPGTPRSAGTRVQANDKEAPQGAGTSTGGPAVQTGSGCEGAVGPTLGAPQRCRCVRTHLLG